MDRIRALRLTEWVFTRKTRTPKSERRVGGCARFLGWDRPAIGYPLYVAIMCEPDEPRPSEEEAVRMAIDHFTALKLTEFCRKPDHIL